MILNPIFPLLPSRYGLHAYVLRCVYRGIRLAFTASVRYIRDTFFETPYAKFSCRSTLTFTKLRALQIKYTAHSIYIVQQFLTFLSRRDLLWLQKFPSTSTWLLVILLDILKRENSQFGLLQKNYKFINRCQAFKLHSSHHQQISVSRLSRSDGDQQVTKRTLGWCTNSYSETGIAPTVRQRSETHKLYTTDLARSAYGRLILDSTLLSRSQIANIGYLPFC